MITEKHFIEQQYTKKQTTDIINHKKIKYTQPQITLLNTIPLVQGAELGENGESNNYYYS